MGPQEGIIYQQMANIMADVPAIPKAQQNKQQGYAFRGIDDMYNALHSLFVKHQVVIYPEVLSADYVQQLAGRNQNLATDARLRIRYSFAAVDGSTVTIVMQGESRDFADKATNQAMSTALKYGLLEMFLIPLEGVTDADAESPVIASDSTEAPVEKPPSLAEKRMRKIKDAAWTHTTGTQEQRIIDTKMIVAQVVATFGGEPKNQTEVDAILANITEMFEADPDE